MKQMLLLVAVLALGAGGLSAPNDAKGAAEQRSVGPSERYKALVKEYESAREDFMKSYSKAKTDAEREKLKYPSSEGFSSGFMALAKEYPEDPAALDALTWVATNCRQGQDFETSLDLLASRHIQSTNLASVARTLVYSDSDKAEAFLRTVLKNTPHHEVKGQATYALGRLLNGRGRSAANTGKKDEAEEIFEDLAANYSDVKWYRGSLSDAAKGELFEMRSLAIGKVAPDIEGEDVDGHKLKLSDYRGKVVVIDFWGDW